MIPVCDLGQRTQEVHSDKRQGSARGEQIYVLLEAYNSAPCRGARLKVPYGGVHVAGHVGPVVLPSQGVVHPGPTELSRQPWVMSQVLHLGPYLFQNDALQFLIKGASAPESRTGPRRTSSPALRQSVRRGCKIHPPPALE